VTSRPSTGVTFTVPPGLMTGFVGGNGAGKTTTMRMIMGVLGIHGGEVTWGDHPMTAADRRASATCPRSGGSTPSRRSSSSSSTSVSSRGCRRAAKAVIAEHLERFGLGRPRGDKVEKLSLGNQQRVQIIAAVMPQPAALILDEPFSGLDPGGGRLDGRPAPGAHRARGVPVLFSSHQLDLVERLCDRLVMLAGRPGRRGGGLGPRPAGPMSSLRIPVEPAERYRSPGSGRLHGRPLDAGWVTAGTVPGVVT
jgi:ABC-2 type transport system ATP-binding protein